MNIIDKHILKNFAVPFFYCLTIFVLLYIVIDLFGNLDEILKNNVDLDIVVYYYLTFIPAIFVQTAPISTLLATLYSLGNLNRNNEISAMRTSGMSIYRILCPLLCFGAIVSLLVFLVNDKVVPKSSMMTSKIKNEIIEKNVPPSKQRATLHDIAIYGANNRIIYARSYERNKNTLNDVIIYEHDKNQRLKTKISAKYAIWKDGSWLFKNGVIYDVDEAGKIVGQPRVFDGESVDLDETPEDLLNKEWRAEFMNYKELRAHIQKFSGASSKTLKKLQVDLNYKISLPLISMLVILVGAPFAMKTQRSGALMGLGVAVFIGFLYYGILAISLALGKAGILPPLLSAWLSNIIFLSAGLYLVKKLG